MAASPEPSPLASAEASAHARGRGATGGTGGAGRAQTNPGRVSERRRDRLRRASQVVWLAVGVLVLVYAALRVLGRPLAVIVPPVLLALLIVYVLNPMVNALARRRVPRLAGTALSYVGFAMVVTVLVATLAPMLTRQVASFTAMAPDLGTQLVSNVNALLASLGLDLRVGALDSPEMGEQVQSLLSSEQIRTAAMALLGGLSGLAGSAFHLLLVVILGPVIAFYLLVDLPRLSAAAWQAVPPRRRPELQHVARQLGAVVGGFVRGQLLVALFVGTGVTIGLAIVGLPFWLLIGVVAGVTNIVPLVGPFVAGVLGITVALFTGGPSLALLVLLVLVVVQQIDNHLVSPLVMGRTVRIHPLMVLLALLVAGSLYGIFGMLLAVPTVAGAKVLVVHLWRTRVPWAEGAEGTQAEDEEDKEAEVADGGAERPAPEPSAALAARSQHSAGSQVASAPAGPPGAGDPRPEQQSEGRPPPRVSARP